MPTSVSRGPRKATVQIHPYFAPFFQSFFLEGLQRVFGARNLRFSARPFPAFRRSGFLKFIVETPGDLPLRVFVDEWDSPVFEEGGLAWCDVYVKRSIDPSRMPHEHAHKVLPAGPTFPVRCAPALTAAHKSVATWILAATSARTPYSTYKTSKEHFASWFRQWSYGLPVDAYEPGTSRPDYVFFSSSIWREESETNRTRALFIQASRDLPGITFEGGFTPRLASTTPEYDALTMPRRYTHEEFIERTKRSAVAFNNPAVERVFSWRLGESLALGKAIISTPIERLLPAPLVHGEHVHMVDPTLESIREAVIRICSDHAYRARLEQGARQYYLEHGAPEAAVRRSLAAAARQRSA